jgi:hypothetical protein
MQISIHISLNEAFRENKFRTLKPKSKHLRVRTVDNLLMEYEKTELGTKKGKSIDYKSN